MVEKAPTLHLFADMLARVQAVCGALGAENGWPAGIDMSRIVVEPPRDPAHGDMATNAAMVLAKEASTIAALVAMSPWLGSRGGSTMTRD